MRIVLGVQVGDRHHAVAEGLFTGTAVHADPPEDQLAKKRVQH
jgi:hypothetical protein